MTMHGFGGGKLYSEKATLDDKDKIAECISNIPGVLWAHVVHKGYSYDSREKETRKLRENTDVKDRYDIIFEMTHKKVDIAAIEKCALEHGHRIRIELITIRDRSWRRGRPGTHPKDET